MNKSASLWLFLIGLGSQTQFHFVGSLGISELPVLLLAPFLFVRDCRKLKADGFMPFLWLVIFTCLGCILGAKLNGSPLVFTLKAFAFPYAIFSSTIVFHHLLRNDMGSIKWFIVGTFLSSIVNIFIFQPEVHTAHGGEIATGDAAVAAMMGYALFWSNRIRSLIMLPVSAFYLATPWLYSVLAPLLSAVVYILFSKGSGRSAAVVSLGIAFLIYVGGKKRRTMVRIGRNFFVFMVVSIVLLFAIKGAYSWAAPKGMLGEDARVKYYRQTRAGTGLIGLLMGGRMEFFCGLMAAIDKPILGHGPKAEDKNGYVERYLAKYGTDEDLRNYLGEIRLSERIGNGGYAFIPTHSYIVSFWVQYGIFGLLLWLYVLYQAILYLRKYAPMVPQWYGYLCVGICNLLWDAFFSPFAGRLAVPCMITCVLFAKAVYERKLTLPYKMEIEAQKAEK